MFKSLKIKMTILMIALVTLFSTGCSNGKYKSIMSFENNTNNSIKMSYSSFEGYKYRKLKLKEGDELNLNIEVTTKEGTLIISLTDKDDNEVFKVENPVEPIAETIKIEEDSTYTLKIEGEHKGSYNITWDIKHTQ